MAASSSLLLWGYITGCHHADTAPQQRTKKQASARCRGQDTSLGRRHSCEKTLGQDRPQCLGAKSSSDGLVRQAGRQRIWQFPLVKWDGF